MERTYLSSLFTQVLRKGAQNWQLLKLACGDQYLELWVTRVCVTSSCHRMPPVVCHHHTSRVGVWGLGFRVRGYGLGFRVTGSGCTGHWPVAGDNGKSLGCNHLLSLAPPLDLSLSLSLTHILCLPPPPPARPPSISLSLSLSLARVWVNS